MNKKEKKQKFQEVLLQSVPITYEGMQCWCPVDIADEEILKDRDIIKGLVPFEKRSIQANALWAVWYSQISKCLDGNHSTYAIKCFCKLHFGVKLLRRQDETFKTFYDKHIRHLDYEVKMVFMEIVPITSKLNRDNGQKYQTAMQQYYAELGIVLEIL